MKRKLIKSILSTSLVLSMLLIPTTSQAAWQNNGIGWWNSNDSQLGYSIDWDYINGRWYYFDDDGYMVVGWLNDKGSWYYLQSDGSMAKNTWIGNYYVDNNGVMAKNQWINDYYVGDDGAWNPNINSRNGWRSNSKGWWYEKRDGYAVANNWAFIENNWYYFGVDGYMLSNQWVGNYYVRSDGSLATNEWIGQYFVGYDGKWIPDYQNNSKGSWVQDEKGWKFKDSYNNYLTGRYKIAGQSYYFDRDGYMLVNGWYIINGKYYYFHTDGSMAIDQWIGNYYVGSDGSWSSSR